MKLRILSRKLPAWVMCLLLIAIGVGVSWNDWVPISHSRLTREALVLEASSASEKAIFLDFGRVEQYQVARTANTESLLEDSAVGQTLNVTARLQKHRSGNYYRVFALSRPDGTVYLTIPESEAARQAALPRSITIFVALEAACCALVIWLKRHPCSENTPQQA